MLTAIALLCVGALIGWCAALSAATRSLRTAAGLVRVRVVELPQHVGSRVRFPHPTRRRTWVEGRLIAVHESALCAAWVGVHVEAPDGSRTAYEAHGRSWAEVATQ